MVNNPVIPIILCGGSGTRLWPLSRKSFPKQFLSLNPLKNNSLLQDTYERVKDLKNIKEPILICNEEHRFIVAEQMRELSIKPSSILLEPFGRNTAPAITIAALKALQIEKDPILLILSSDHEIKDNNKFLRAINLGIKHALEGYLITFGVIPSSPETGFGYIKSHEILSKNELKALKIEEFIEKPDQKRAAKFLQDDRFTWNSGMFLFKASEILKEIEKFSPQIITSCKESIENDLFDLDFQRIDKKSFSKCPNLSIDVAVMENTKKGLVIPLDAGWSDLGSWRDLWKISNKDDLGNTIQGNVLVKETSNCYLRGEHRLIAAIGLKNLIIVETKDAILIVDQSRSQEVKTIVNDLKEQNIPEGKEHKKIFRPWGFYESIENGKRWQVKLINVKAGETLSLQLHHHRSEHWIVVSGIAKVEIDDKKLILHENQSSYIPQGSKHRLSNPGKIPLKLIEIQSGSYLGEDDIVRFEDHYGRTFNN